MTRVTALLFTNNYSLHTLRVLQSTMQDDYCSWTLLVVTNCIERAPSSFTIFFSHFPPFIPSFMRRYYYISLLKLCKISGLISYEITRMFALRWTISLCNCRTSLNCVNQKSDHTTFDPWLENLHPLLPESPCSWGLPFLTSGDPVDLGPI